MRALTPEDINMVAGGVTSVPPSPFQVSVPPSGIIPDGKIPAPKSPSWVTIQPSDVAQSTHH